MKKYIRGDAEISKEEFEATKECLSVADVERERKAVASRSARGTQAARKAGRGDKG